MYVWLRSGGLKAHWGVERSAKYYQPQHEMLVSLAA